MISEKEKKIIKKMFKSYREDFSIDGKRFSIAFSHIFRRNGKLFIALEVLEE